jgi:hypothetical protein
MLGGRGIVSWIVGGLPFLIMSLIITNIKDLSLPFSANIKTIFLKHYEIGVRGQKLGVGGWKILHICD